MPKPTDLDSNARAELRIAQAKTILFFESFLLAGVPKPPVHATNGLPKMENCMGYAYQYDVFRATGMLMPEFYPYCLYAAFERGLPIDDIEMAFILGFEAPATPLAELKAKSGARALLTEMRQRGYKPGVPLQDEGPDVGLPLVKELWSAYAAAYAALHATQPVTTQGD